MNQIKFSCPYCCTEFNITEELFDIPLKCSVCSGTFTVPHPGKNISEPQNAESPSASTAVTKLKNFIRKNKKLIIPVLTVLILTGGYYLSAWLSFKYWRDLPVPLKKASVYVCLPGNRIEIYYRLLILSLQDNREEAQAEVDYYAEEGLKLLEKCEETPAVLEKNFTLSTEVTLRDGSLLTVYG